MTMMPRDGTNHQVRTAPMAATIRQPYQRFRHPANLTRPVLHGFHRGGGWKRGERYLPRH
jgi:hypothetical protein